jgi:5-methylcytosine-specific restriction endonuclease McrA
MRMRTCCGCGHAFVPRHAQVFRCERCEPTGRDQKDPTTRAQRDGTGDYERNRAIVLEGAPACVYCGAPATTADHVVAVANGGGHELANLVPACGRCNARKGARTAPVAPHAFHVPDVHEVLGPTRLA